MGAAALAATQVLALGSLSWLVWQRIGPPTAIGYALLAIATIQLTWDRVPKWFEIATCAFLLSVVLAFLALIPRFVDGGDPAYRDAVARASMTWRTYVGLPWIVRMPPATIRRLWRGEPFPR